VEWLRERGLVIGRSNSLPDGGGEPEGTRAGTGYSHGTVKNLKRDRVVVAIGALLFKPVMLLLIADVGADGFKRFFCVPHIVEAAVGPEAIGMHVTQQFWKSGDDALG
jgi:hypothetical protein